MSRAADGVVEVLEARRADDGRRDAGLRAAPTPARPGSASRRAPPRPRPRGRRPRSRRPCSRGAGRSRRSSRARCRPSPPARRLPARKPRASGLHGMTPTPSVAAERHHLALLLAVDQVVVVLHRRRSASSRAGRPGASALRELPGVHARRADVARLARLAPRRAAPRASPRSASRGRSGGSGRGRRSRCPSRRSEASMASHDVLARQPAVVGAVAHRDRTTLVAMTTSSRAPKSRSARPTISSLTPREYMSAVSKKLMPSSSARRMNGRLSSSSAPTGARPASRRSSCRGRAARPSGPIVRD